MTPGSLFLIALAIIVVGLLAHLAFRWVRVGRDAREEWAYRSVHDASALVGVSEAQFHQAYVRANGPRGATFAAAAVGLNALLTPLTMTALAGIWRAGWIAYGRPAHFSETTLIWQFYMFFGLIAVWVGVAWLFARVFHQRRRGTVDQEIQKLVRLSS